MTVALEISTATLIVLAALAAGFGLGAVWERRRTRGAEEQQPEPPPAPEPDAAGDLRSFALDAISEAVLIVDPEGRVQDCNSAALSLLDRHRSSIEDQFASTLRRFEVLDQRDPARVAADHALWSGEAWLRQPDGSTRLCTARVMALRGSAEGVTGYVESYRDAVNDRAMGEEFRNLLYGVRIYNAATTLPEPCLRATRDELRLLGEAFHGLDRVIREYERLLPSLAADDPLAEVIAGAAHDARAAVSEVGVAELLEEVPRSLARLRGHIQRLSELLLAAREATGSSTHDTADSPVTARTVQ